MAVTANITVSFGTQTADASGHLSAEVDDRETGLNRGKTSFVPGDTVGILVYKSDNVTYDTPVVSAGTIRAGAAQTVTKTQDITFAGESTATLSVPATAITGTQWVGRQLGAITLAEDKMTVSVPANDDPKELVGVCRVTYTAAAESWMLASPTSAAMGGLTEFQIAVFFLGALTEA